MGNHLRRLSTVFSFKTSDTLVKSTSENNALSKFLVDAKATYLSTLKETPEKAKEYLVVMGNEAGDLDSVASSIAYAWISAQTRPSIPFIQIRKDDLVLRPENMYALALAGIQTPNEDLLLPEDISSLSSSPFTKFALVDHNRLGSSFASNESSVEVIIDHHEDEQQHLTANPRIVTPAGSCSSHIALAAPENLPSELAFLLLSAILIDTNGLKPGGKATQIDLDAVTRLLPQTTQLSTQSFSSTALHEHSALKNLNTLLGEHKSNISHLSPRDQLRRDYKEYSLKLEWHTDKPTIKAGLSTVPVRLKEWASQGRLLSEGVAYMEERDLSVLGVLTSFRKEGKLSKRGKHVREMAWLVKSDTGLEERLWKGLESDPELRVESHAKFKVNETEGVKVRVYKQGNANATRKATAPILKKILEAKL